MLFNGVFITCIWGISTLLFSDKPFITQFDILPSNEDDTVTILCAVDSNLPPNITIFDVTDATRVLTRVNTAKEIREVITLEGCRATARIKCHAENAVGTRAKNLTFGHHSKLLCEY